MGGPGVTLKAKPSIKANVEMRKFHWAVVDPTSVSNTLWKDLDESEVQLDVKEFESMFGVNAVPADGAVGGTGAVGGAGGVRRGSVTPRAAEEKKVVLVDPKKSFNLDISLSRFRASLEQIRDAILTCDESMLTEERLESLLKYCPTDEEFKAVKNFKVSGNYPALLRV